MEADAIAVLRGSSSRYVVVMAVTSLKKLDRKQAAATVFRVLSVSGAHLPNE